jgi:hypothetical protein
MAGNSICSALTCNRCDLSDHSPFQTSKFVYKKYPTTASKGFDFTTHSRVFPLSLPRFLFEAIRTLPISAQPKPVIQTHLKYPTLISSPRSPGEIKCQVLTTQLSLHSIALLFIL